MARRSETRFSVHERPGGMAIVQGYVNYEITLNWGPFNLESHETPIVMDAEVIQNAFEKRDQDRAIANEFVRWLRRRKTEAEQYVTTKQGQSFQAKDLLPWKELVLWFQNMPLDCARFNIKIQVVKKDFDMSLRAGADVYTLEDPCRISMHTLRTLVLESGELPTCLGCGRGDMVLLKCSACKRAGINSYYCNFVCQRQHWSTHRIDCPGNRA